MPGFSLDDYEPVADRIERFWKDHPEGRILTEMVHRDEQQFIVQALIYRGYKLNGEAVGPDATGYAQEIIGSTNVNRTSALENCETSAIGRALANLGYAVKNRASREEMAKAAPTPRPRSGGRVSPSDKGQSTEKRSFGVGASDLQESHEEAPRTNGNVEQAAGIARLKTNLLGLVGGDKERATTIWIAGLDHFGLDRNAPVPVDMLQALEAHLIDAAVPA